MSVVIKTINMPDKCLKCFAMRRPYSDKVCLPQCAIKMRHILDISIRQEWCPLIEMGNIADADKLAEVWHGDREVRESIYEAVIA